MVPIKMKHSKKHSNIVARSVFLYAMTMLSTVSVAENPLWEIGVGFASVSAPDYRGSEERTGFLAPIPYLVYRGDRLEVDKGKIKGLLYEGDRLILDVSAFGSVPVDSQNNQARKGMPDLEPTLEVGPELEYRFWEQAQQGRELRLSLPLRGVFEIDFDQFNHVGWILEPKIKYKDDQFGPDNGYEMGLALGLVFADQRYHRYFYQVDQEYINEQRRGYQAEAGYSGWQFTAAVRRRFKKLWFGAFVRYDQLTGAVIEDSPLVTSNNGVTVGLALAWILRQSEQMVEQ